MSGGKVLVYEQHPVTRNHICSIMEFLEYEPVTVEGPEALNEHLGNPPDAIWMVLLGGAGANGSAVEVLRKIRSLDPHIPVVLVLDPKGGIKLTAELEAGVIDMVEMPLRARRVNSVLQKVQTFRENRHQNGSPRNLELFRNLVGSSKGIQRVRKMIEMVASSDANVLITGESGTGKEVVARHIHYHSARRNKPFVPVNCGAIPPDLLESELFGHEKGAFTGAITARQGRFEMADGGTLFLDEIGDMSLNMQVKLLRVLQERTFERVGSNKSITVNVRIIAATHVNLEKAIESGRFREDLFYRLNVFPIETPPLRDRVEDLPLLVNDLIERSAHEGHGSLRLTPTAMQSLGHYKWPGNVRELANLIERLSILYPNGVVDLHDLPEKYQATELVAKAATEVAAEAAAVAPGVADPGQFIRLPRGGIDLKEHLTSLEYNLILQALQESNWVVAHAAKRLMMGRTTLVEKMRKLGLQRDEEGAAGI
ncbi:MAG: Transcriptional regulatory protein ZraR [Gammaproteobacteria bacterium]|nr:Transcriptional regulatory protein ZraR [Gammaproteobacteria bacterium]